MSYSKKELNKKLKANRLINEKSPYLLQHAYNPVDWYPWCEEAFNTAKIENKPVFLSIGYSTCHWCHVMAHESFEDDEVARLMNDTFINIKVDREERPDIDAIYMNVCQLLTGSGGWPLTIIMTPDKQPFYAATYIPKNSRYGRIGMLELIPLIKEIWEKRYDEIQKITQQLHSSLRNITIESNGTKMNTDVIDEAYSQFRHIYDNENGGFGSAPKFPSPHNFMFLLRYWKRTKNKDVLNMVVQSLDKMSSGGIFDHVGYGFHRYSTDKYWKVPHFEKMLYDQALLTIAYTECYLETKNKKYENVVNKTIQYVLRNLTSENGGFFSAEDADSEGKEGKFYLWSYEELENVLDQDEFNIFTKVFNIKHEGNFLEEATGRETGANILYLKKPLVELQNDFDILNLEDKIEEILKKLFLVREKRQKPFLDDKILVDWNGLMIAALSKAYKAFENNEYIIAAKKACEFILDSLMQNNRLYHMYKDGEWRILAYLDDYAFMIWGLLELYEATFEINYLEAALKLNDDVFKYFSDDKKGGFYFTPYDNEQLLIRNKEIYDGAIPSGNSVMAMNLLKLSRITGNISFEEKAHEFYVSFSKAVKEHPIGYSYLLCSVDYALTCNFEIVIVGNPDSEETKQIIKILRNEFLPNKVILFKPTNEKEAHKLHKIAEYTKYQDIVNNKTTVYICKDFVCNKPINDLTEVLNFIKNIS
ncbi:thioredoxin domain-containing protein [Caldicellulosiruptoraceae bacterium PP1]